MKSRISVVLIILGISFWLYSQMSASVPNKSVIRIDKPIINKDSPKSDTIKTGGTGVVIDICKVDKAKKPLDEANAEHIIKGLLSAQQGEYETGEEGSNATMNPIVLCSSIDNGQKLVPTYTHALVQAVYSAYADHRPLTLSPDMVWLMIAQGFSLHVKENSEDLRGLFVDHAGQINLDVERAYYAPESKDFWQGIFPDFSKAIGENTKGEVKELMTPSFSGTTIVEKAAFEITLMDAMSAYFQYSMSISCGIPSIKIEGTTADWKNIENRLEQLAQYDLKWWTDELKPIIAEFRKATEGQSKSKFWKDIFIKKDADVVCGSVPYYKGWIFKFFPYLKQGRKADGTAAYVKNSIVTSKEQNAENAPRIELSDLPSGLAKAKVLLNNNGVKSILYFNAGFSGIAQDSKTMELRPDIQWFVVDTQTKPTKAELAKYYE